MNFKFIKSSIAILVLVAFNFIGCSSEKVSSYNNSKLIEECSYLYNYANENNIKINNFSERDKVLDMLSASNSEKDIIYLKTDSNLFSKANYKVTNEKTNIIYYGKVKDNKPNGLGVIYLVNEDGAKFIKYAGNFKKGLFEGYGMLFKIPTMDKLRNVTLMYNNNEEKAKKKTNYLSVEGEFKDGLVNGKGNYFIYVCSNKEEDEIKDLFVGEYEIDDDERITGKVKEYKYGYLYYDGEYKNSHFNGDGILYFLKSKQKQYEGSFRNGKYDGKGTLYDEGGNTIYSGKWDMGDYE